MVRAHAVQPSYIALGAVFPTTLKKMATAPQGLARLGAYVRLMQRYPLVAIGGISADQDRKSTRLNSSHSQISYAVFCLKKKKKHNNKRTPTGLQNPTGSQPRTTAYAPEQRPHLAQPCTSLHVTVPSDCIPGQV